jgi:hypothetical protein
MKKIQLLVLVLVFLSACKNDKKDSENTIETIETDMENDGLTLLEGNFIYYADAAVFQTQTSLFGVVINEKSQELANQAKPLKKQDTDMVKARVKGTIEKKPEGEEGWDFRINIKKIISVEALPAKENEVITLEKK